MERRKVLASVVWLAAITLLAACGGPGGPALIDPNSGRIGGKLSIAGPYDAAAPLTLSLQLSSGQQVETLAMGKVPSTVGAFFDGHAINFSFGGLFVTDYNIVVSTVVAKTTRILYTSGSIRPEFNGVTAIADDSFSFLGPAPYGSIAGKVTLTGTWPATGQVFIAVTPTGQSGTPRTFRWPVQAADVVTGKLVYKVPALPFLSYNIGLSKADVQGSVTSLGTGANPIAVAATLPDVTGTDFNAAF